MKNFCKPGLENTVVQKRLLKRPFIILRVYLFYEYDIQIAFTRWGTICTTCTAGILLWKFLQEGARRTQSIWSSREGSILHHWLEIKPCKYVFNNGIFGKNNFCPNRLLQTWRENCNCKVVDENMQHFIDIGVCFNETFYKPFINKK